MHKTILCNWENSVSDIASLGKRPCNARRLSGLPNLMKTCSQAFWYEELSYKLESFLYKLYVYVYSKFTCLMWTWSQHITVQLLASLNGYLHAIVVLSMRICHCTKKKFTRFYSILLYGVLGTLAQDLRRVFSRRLTYSALCPWFGSTSVIETLSTPSKVLTLTVFPVKANFRILSSPPHPTLLRTSRPNMGIPMYVIAATRCIVFSRNHWGKQ